MTDWLFLALDWSEVWALIIPLLILTIRKTQPSYLRPVIIYLWLALLLNLTGDVISEFKHRFPPWLKWLHSNNVIYNVHSIVRFVCFSYFFRLLGTRFRTWLDNLINVTGLILMIANFLFLENFTNPDHLSGNLLATEAFILMIYCMQYYLLKLQEKSDDFVRTKDFWVVTGLSIYVVVNFFVFLFYVPLLAENPELSVELWYVHNIAYIVLCIFISKAFYDAT